MAETAPSLLRVTLRAVCPACGRGAMYQGLLSISDRCIHCGLAIKDHDAGDGPAFFAMFITSVIVVVGAMVIEFTLHASLWWHVVIWPPVTVVLSVLLLRVIKAWLIGLQYRHNVLGFRNKE